MRGTTSETVTFTRTVNGDDVIVAVIEASPIRKRPMLLSPAIPVVGIEKQWWGIDISQMVFNGDPFLPEQGDIIKRTQKDNTEFEVVPETVDTPIWTYTTSERERILVHTQRSS